MRATIDVAPGISQEDLYALVLTDPKCATYLDGQEVKKVIFVADKIMNIIV
jgi:leucyl-tRNA synthetase